jgi:hypothetical protein
MNINPVSLRQVSVFQNATDDDLILIAAHALERSIEAVNSSFSRAIPLFISIS